VGGRVTDEADCCSHPFDLLGESGDIWHEKGRFYQGAIAQKTVRSFELGRDKRGDTLPDDGRRFYSVFGTASPKTAAAFCRRKNRSF